MGKPTFETLERCLPDVDFMAFANEVIDQYIPNWDFSVDTSNPNMHHIMGLSGGVDSSAMAAVLLVKHPEVNWHLFMADTGNESSDVMDIVKIFSEKLGAKITIGHPEKDLFESIEHNGYLPSSKQRWCTYQLKIKVLQGFMNELFECDDAVATNYAGIRYDERDRAGLLSIPRIFSSHPFVDQKVTREAVVKIASALGVLGGNYRRGKSRSGCLNCFYQSKQEIISLAIWSPRQFEIGAKVEKLNQSITELLDDSSNQIPNFGYYTGYPMSSMCINSKQTLTVSGVLGGDIRIDDKGVNWDYRSQAIKKTTRRRKVDENQQAMFEDCEIDSQKYLEDYVDIYVGIEHLIHPLMRDSNLGVYSQLPVSFSTTVSGLTNTLNGYLYHRRTVSAGIFVSEQHYEDQSHITILCLRFPRSILPKIDYEQDGVYTWSQGVSYAEISHTLRAINRLCHFHYCQQMLDLRAKYTIDGRTISESKSYIKLVENSGVEIGELVGIGHFKPMESMKELRDFSYDESAKTIRCIACSL